MPLQAVHKTKRFYVVQEGERISRHPEIMKEFLEKLKLALKDVEGVQVNDDLNEMELNALLKKLREAEELVIAYRTLKSIEKNETEVSSTVEEKQVEAPQVMRIVPQDEPQVDSFEEEKEVSQEENIDETPEAFVEEEKVQEELDVPVSQEKSQEEEPVIEQREEVVEEKKEIEPEPQPEATNNTSDDEESIEELEKELEAEALKMGIQKSGVELNERNKQEDDNSLGYRLQKSAIRDLRAAIGLNERFLFANELFDGNMEAFNRALNELNHIESRDDAYKFINMQLRERFKWNEESEVTEKFLDLVERRFL